MKSTMLHLLHLLHRKNMMMQTKTEKIKLDSFFDGLSGKAEPSSVIEISDETTVDRLNRLIKAGALFDVGADDFELRGAENLTPTDRDFIEANKDAILCTIHQSLLVGRQALAGDGLTDFAVEIAEREGILSESETVTEETHFEAVRQTARKWFENCLTANERIRKL